MRDRYELHKLEYQCMARVLECNGEFQAIFGRGYLPVEEYRSEDAEVVLVTSGSTVGTARPVIDDLRQKGHRVGLVKMKMFRPFPKKLARERLEGKGKILVIDRNLSPGQGGIFYQELRGALCGAASADQMYGFISGLGGADITPALIEKAIMFTIRAARPPDEPIWLGLSAWEGEDAYDKATVKIQ
jgi:pyruvate/2-oxoacid:ferredoxin oxidoreductase alpha subunit